MDKIIFNFHDMVLAMTIVLTVIFSLLLLSSHKMRNSSAYLLAGFMIAHGFISLHELTYYAEQFRYIVMDISANLFFIGSFAYCCDAVLLSLYVSSIIYKDFTLSKKDLVHLLPLALYIIYMIATYYSLDTSPQRLAISQWRLTNSWHFVSIEAVIRVIRIAYLCHCLLLIARYRKHHQDSFADISSIDLSWLKLLVFGFLLVLTGEVLLSCFKVINIFSTVSESVFIAIGVTGYYVTFLLIVALLFYSVAKSPATVPISNKELADSLAEPSDLKYDYIEKIERIMKEEKPYLIADITIDSLAEKLGVFPKDLSVTLNRHFRVNFYEYINQHRINEAKKILLSDTTRSITDIVYDVGFNSKSVFYTFFKKSQGMTPSEYRKNQQL